MAIVFALNVGVQPGSGSLLFSTLHGVLHVATWSLVPIMAADCISCERGEGTLGLLFLRALKPFDIILAKSAAMGCEWPP